MKKIISMALLAAMVLSCFAGCAMQKGEIDVNAYAEEANVQDVSGETSAPGILDALRTNVEKAKTNSFAATEVDVWVEGTALDDSWTSDNTIKTAAQFMDFHAKLSGGEKFAGVTITFAKNINLSGAKFEGTATEFRGNFDGGNCVIYNFDLTLDAQFSHGFLGNFGGSTVQNFALVDVECDVINGTKSKQSVGALFGYINTKATAGGDNNLKNLYTDATFNFQEGMTFDKVGGLVGRITNENVRIFTNCEFAGSMVLNGNGGQSFGGIVAYRGKKGALNFTNCLNSGTIGDSKAVWVGGILGSQTDSSTGTLSFVNCANTGNITGNNAVGGMIGHIEASSSLTMTDCLNSGTIIANGKNGGGMVGESNVTTSITGCTNTGSVIGASNVSFTAGQIQGTATIENCTNSGTVLSMAGYQTSAVVEGKYDLRFVAVFDAPKAQAAGFVVTINYKDAQGKQVKVENATVYANTVYTSVKGTNAEEVEEIYQATDLGGTYLYTLVIENIDAAYTDANGSLEILVTPFVAENAETVVNGSQVKYGGIVIEEPAA